jgi:hypothetical protein
VIRKNRLDGQDPVTPGIKTSSSATPSGSAQKYLAFFY